MTRNDTAKIFVILQAAYPQFYGNMTEENVDEIWNLWYEMFSEYPVDIVKYALKKLIKTHGNFPPTIADLDSKIQELLTAMKDEPSDEELWQMLRAGIMDGRLGAEEHFEKFPEVLKRYCGSPQWLRNHADYDLNTFDTVEKAHFLRQIKDMKNRVNSEAEIAALKSVYASKMLDSGANRMSLQSVL